MSRARTGQKRVHQPLYLLVVLGLIGGCDPGLVPLGPPSPTAVGAFTRVLFIDFCTRDVKERTRLLYRCTDDTPTEVLSATVGAPFEVVSSDTARQDGGEAKGGDLVGGPRHRPRAGPSVRWVTEVHLNVG